jgi:hypothetical protein
MTPALETYLIRYRERYQSVGCRGDSVSDAAIVRAVRGLLMSVAKRALRREEAARRERAMGRLPPRGPIGILGEDGRTAITPAESREMNADGAWRAPGPTNDEDSRDA